VPGFNVHHLSNTLVTLLITLGSTPYQSNFGPHLTNHTWAHTLPTTLVPTPYQSHLGPHLTNHTCTHITLGPTSHLGPHLTNHLYSHLTNHLYSHLTNHTWAHALPTSLGTTITYKNGPPHYLYTRPYLTNNISPPMDIYVPTPYQPTHMPLLSTIHTHLVLAAAPGPRLGHSGL